MRLSVTAVIPASTRHRKINFKNCFLASLLSQSTSRRYVGKNINEQSHVIIICAPTTVISQQNCTGGLRL